MKQPQHPGYLADNNDIFVLWLCLLFAGVGAIVVSFLHAIPVQYSSEALLLVGIGLVAWTVSAVARTHGRRGCLSTSFGTFLVRGSKLKGVRHGDVSEIRRRRIATRRQRFTALELVTREGQKLTMYADAGWATVAVAAIEKAIGKTLPVSES